ncbi:hypothetical protein Fmac_018722 [Flemingia macrophylla]|uniref:Uncharacterized protein n=1 Tax=Flemingia macrophylla TaxID=520843 RepID=A0ABD1M5X8_9FABA
MKWKNTALFHSFLWVTETLFNQDLYLSLWRGISLKTLDRSRKRERSRDAESIYGAFEVPKGSITFLFLPVRLRSPRKAQL